MDEKERLTRHHKTPRSRGGKDHPSNIKIVEYRLHAAWHILFEHPRDKINMTPVEAIAQVRVWAREDLADFAKPLPLKKRLAWNKIFGQDVTPSEAIEIIKREWS